MSGLEELTRHDYACLAETGEEAQTTINSAGIKATRADDVGVAWGRTIFRHQGTKAAVGQAPDAGPKNDVSLLRAISSQPPIPPSGEHYILVFFLAVAFCNTLYSGRLLLDFAVYN